MKAGGFFRPRPIFSAGRQVHSAPEQDRTEHFRQTVMPHMDAAYTLARYLCRDASAAEDIVQEAFLRAFRSFDGWRGEAPKAWLLAIVRNCFLTHVAAGRRQAMHAIDEVAANPPPELIERDDPEALLAGKTETAMLRTMIEQLPEPFRETLVLRELEELSYKEIAAITQVPIGTVMSRLARARQLLGERLLPPGAAAQGARP